MTTPTITTPAPRSTGLDRLGRRMFEVCIVADGSLLTPGDSLWTAENLRELQRRSGDLPDNVGQSWSDRIDAALTGASAPIRQLFAEVCILSQLPLRNSSATKTSKVRLVKHILQPIKPRLALPEDIADALGDGSVDVDGRNRRWAQLRVLIAFAEYFKDQAPRVRRRAATTPTALRHLMDVAPGPDEPGQRYALLYLFRPDYFLPVADAGQRTRLRDALAAEYLPSGMGTDVDADLRTIDDAVQARSGGPVDYFAPPWRHRWLDAAAAPVIEPPVTRPVEPAVVPGIGGPAAPTIAPPPPIPTPPPPAPAVTRRYLPLVPGTYQLSSGFETPDRPDHHGIDFAANLGTPIYAPSDGFLARVGINTDPTGFGSWLVLDAQQQWGLDFVFGHMPPSSFINPDTGRQWQENDRVRAGQQIAVVGNEGGSTGPHLHFETWSPPGRFGGRPLNPADTWLPLAVDPRLATAPQPATAVLAAAITPAAVLAPAAADPFPLPPGVYWGPLDGPDNSWSNQAGTEPQSSKDGLRRWQVTLGLPGSAIFDPVTKAAALVIQRAQGRTPDGGVHAADWDAVIRDGWRPPAGTPWPPAPAPSTKDGYAQAIIAEGLRRGISPRGIKIALSTALVETNMVMYANSKDPASLRLPHDAVGSDGMSVGLFQQQNFAEWKSLECRMDAACSAGTFYEHLQKFDYNNEGRSPGRYAQDVQRSAFPDRYDERFAAASALYDRLIGSVTAPAAPTPAVATLVAATPVVMPVVMPVAMPANTPAAAVAAPNVKSPGGYPITWVGGPGCNLGHREYVRIYLHTTESQDWVSTAEGVADYQTRTKDDPKLQGSYHYLVDDTHIINTVATKNTAWAVLSDNPFSVNIALVGTSGEIEQWPGENPNREERPKHREQWLRHDKMLDMVAYTIAVVSRDYQIPIERVDIDGVGANRRGVSSHNNYTYGSIKLKGFKDGTHWDAPDTFPYDVVLSAASAYLALITDPDQYPLPAGHYWGPLDGPAESWSNMFGNEPKASKDGLTRWQLAVGIPGSGIYDAATKDAAGQLQRAFGRPDTGQVGENEWVEVIKRGWRLPPPAPVLPPAAIDPGPAVGHAKKIENATGPGMTDKFGMAATDLGVMTRTPSGRILAVFGDTFRGPHVGDGDWRAPVALFSDTKRLDDGITWSEAAGGVPGYAAQLWAYPHDNPVFSTVLPSDVITIGDTIYLHAMVNKGLGNVVWTELWKSTDDGHTWQHTGVKFDAGLHDGLAQMWTWDLCEDGWVYILSTGFQRDKPLILRRVQPTSVTDPSAYQSWGRNAAGWSWGSTATPVLQGAGGDAKFGELCLRRIDGQWVLINFDSSNVGGNDIDVRVFTDITGDLDSVHQSTPIRGVGWGQEGDDAVAQLYGPCIVPGSKVDGGFHILLSQWKTDGPDKGWPYRAMQFKIPVSALSGFQDDGAVNPHGGK